MALLVLSLVTVTIGWSSTQRAMRVLWFILRVFRLAVSEHESKATKGAIDPAVQDDTSRRKSLA